MNSVLQPKHIFKNKKGPFLNRKRLCSVLTVFLVLSMPIAQTAEQDYIIKKGDTLWDLAFTFLGDPFQWPQIWHQNSYISNPNLIYPGNTLIIRGETGMGIPSSVHSAGYNNPASHSGAASNGSSENDDFPSETRQALEMSEKSAEFVNKSGVRRNSLFSDTLYKLAMEKRSYFTSDFLEKIGFLWFNKDEKGLVYPGNAALR
jgi:hypothetical protein